MSDTLYIRGLKAERGQKLQTYLPVLDTNTEIPITIINGQNDGPTLLITAGIHGAVNILASRLPWNSAGTQNLNQSRAA